MVGVIGGTGLQKKNSTIPDGLHHQTTYSLATKEERSNLTSLSPLFKSSDVSTKIDRTFTGTREQFCLDALPATTNALVAVQQSAGFAIGRLRVRISAWATLHQGLLSLPSLRGSVNEYQLQVGRQRQVWLIPIADERVGVQVKL